MEHGEEYLARLTRKKGKKKKPQFCRAISPLQMLDVSSYAGADVIEMRFSLYSSRVRVGRIFNEDLTV